MPWENLEEMFPEGFVVINGVCWSLDDVRNSNLEKIEVDYHKPVREMTQKITRLVYYPDGSMERYDIMDVFPPFNVDGIPLLNAYGQKAYINFMDRNFPEDEVNENGENGFDYSLL